MSAMVSVKDVVKGYQRGKQQVEVLRGVDLEVEEGDFLALMGPSGSGKTTLLNMIGGLDSPDAGEVIVAGQQINGLSRTKLTKWRTRNVGFIFQSYNLLPVLSAERNVEVPLFLTNLSKARRKRSVEIAMELVGLADRMKHKPLELSGGQQQRVAIARALVSDPNLLVCDEPTGDLDQDSSQSIMQLIQLLNQEQGKTIIMVTHDPKAADYAGTRLRVDKGLLEQSVEFKP
jgi:putative ABC transport system ATP-binding protein